MKSVPQQNHLVKLLVAKYRADPKGLRAYLPEVAEALEAMFPSRRQKRSPFGLTGHERDHRQQALRQVLDHLKEGSLPREEVVRGLEHCATLIEDDSLPPEAGYESLVQLFRAVAGKSPGTFKAVTTISVYEGQESRVVHHVSLVRGVVLNLTWDRRLISVTISPAKVRERRKALRFVGIAKDPAADVAERHDDYLAEMRQDASS